MSTYPNPYRPPIALNYRTNEEGAAVAQFFNAVYAWMAVGLAVTASIAWYVAGNPQVMQQVFRGPVLIGLIIAQLVLVGVISAAVQRIGATAATVLFVIYAALNGLTLAGLVLIYAHAVLASAFIITAAMFGAMSVYGFVTRRDLTSLGSYLFMALVGLIIAMAVSMFWHPNFLTVMINFFGVAIFVGLTAYDTQKLKAMAVATAGNSQLAARLSISGALALYLDFLNLFIFIVQLLGSQGRNR